MVYSYEALKRISEYDKPITDLKETIIELEQMKPQIHKIQTKSVKNSILELGRY